MYGTFLRLQANFTDVTIPKLYRDKAITSGTKFLYDSVDPFSYAKQAAPIGGVDKWVNMVEGNAPAQFGNGIGFDGAFLFAPSNGTDYITLPASSIVATGADSFVAIFWVRLGTPPLPSGGAAVFSCGSDYSAANQYSATWLNGDLRFHVGGWQSPALNAGTYAPGDIKQLAVSMKKRATDGKYDLTTYINGVVRASSVSSFTSIPQPSVAPYNAGATIANGYAYAAGGWTGAVYRTLLDDCSTMAAAAVVALDWAENHVRII